MKLIKGARRAEAVPVEIDHHTALMGQRRCQSAAKSAKGRDVGTKLLVPHDDALTGSLSAPVSKAHGMRATPS